MITTDTETVKSDDQGWPRGRWQAAVNRLFHTVGLNICYRRAYPGKCHSCNYCGRSLGVVQRGYREKQGQDCAKRHEAVSFNLAEYGAELSGVPCSCV